MFSAIERISYMQALTCAASVSVLLVAAVALAGSGRYGPLPVGVAVVARSWKLTGEQRDENTTRASAVCTLKSGACSGQIDERSPCLLPLSRGWLAGLRVR